MTVLINEPFDEDKTFNEILEHVKSSDANLESSNLQLYEALSKTLLLGHQLIIAKSVKEFVTKLDKTKWNKTAEKNPFHPLVQIVFEKRNPASRSQYASVLKTSHDAGLNSDEFKQYLIEHGGVEKFYSQHLEQKKAVATKEKLELAHASHLAWAKKQLDSRTPIYSIPISNPKHFDNSGDIQFAAVKVIGGKLQVIGRAEISSDEQEKTIIDMAGSPPQYTSTVLSNKAFYDLFVAVDVYCRFYTDAKDVVDENDKQRFEDNEIPASFFAKSGFKLEYVDGIWTGQSVSELPTFKCVIAQIKNGLEQLDKNKTYFISSLDCKGFSDGFLYQGSWKLIQSQFGFELIHTSKDPNAPNQKCEIVEWSIINVNSSFRQLTNLNVEANCSINKTSLVLLSSWKKEIDNKQDFKFPTLLKFDIDPSSQLNLAIPHKPEYRRLLAFDLETPKTPLSDRYIAFDDIVEITKAAIDYDWNFTVSFASTPGYCECFKLNAIENGVRYEINIPLCISVTGELGIIVA